MCDCCPPPAATTTVACPACGQLGAPVRPRTIKAALTTSALRRLSAGPHRFCRTPGCPVVYYADGGDRFAAADLRVPVWQKEPPGARLLCYCFGESETAIREELARDGRCDAVDRIRAHVKARRCACDVRNPAGACCLADVAAAVGRLRADAAAEREMP